MCGKIFHQRAFLTNCILLREKHGERTKASEQNSTHTQAQVALTWQEKNPRSVGEDSARGYISCSIREPIPGESLSSVRNVGKASVSILPSHSTWGSTRERSPTNVLHVAKPSTPSRLSLSARDFTLERDRPTVASAGKPSASGHILTSMKGRTRERSPISVASVGKPSARVLTLTNIGRSTAARSYVAVRVGTPPAEVRPLMAQSCVGVGGGNDRTDVEKFLILSFFQYHSWWKESFQVSFYCIETKFIAEVSILKHSQEVL